MQLMLRHQEWGNALRGIAEGRQVEERAEVERMKAAFGGVLVF